MWVRPALVWRLLSLMNILHWWLLQHKNLTLILFISIICQHKDAVYTCQPFLTAKTKKQGNLSRQQEYQAQQTTKHLHCRPKKPCQGLITAGHTHSWRSGMRRSLGQNLGQKRTRALSRVKWGGQKADTHQDRTSMSSVTAAVGSKCPCKGIWTIDVRKLVQYLFAQLFLNWMGGGFLLPFLFC